MQQASLMARLAGLEGCCCSPLQQERMGSSLVSGLLPPQTRQDTLQSHLAWHSVQEGTCEGSSRQKWLLLSLSWALLALAHPACQVHGPAGDPVEWSKPSSSSFGAFWIRRA